MEHLGGGGSFPPPVDETLDTYTHTSSLINHYMSVATFDLYTLHYKKNCIPLYKKVITYVAISSSFSKGCHHC